MSGNQGQAATQSAPIQPAPRGKASDAWVQRGGLRLNRRGNLFQTVAAMQDKVDAVAAKSAYDTAAAKAKPTLDAAEKVLALPNPGAAVSAARTAFDDAGVRLQAALATPDHIKALQDLRDKEAAAGAVLRAKGTDDGAVLRTAQIATQAAQYNEMNPALTDVKRTYLPDGAADGIRAQKLKADAEFDDFVTKLGRLEKAKQGRKPTDAFPPKDAQIIKDYCNDVVNTAQAYLAKAKTLPASSDTDKKTQYCQENLVAARHYGMAMDMDIAGQPTQNAPWDRETAMRMAGTRVAFSYEQGMGNLDNTKDGGASGASGSYWVRSKGADAVANDLAAPDGAKSKGKRDFIFKPAAQEESPEGMHDQPGAGAVKEAFAASNAKLLAQQTGIDLGVPETSIAAIGQYAMKDGDLSQPTLVGSAQMNAGVSMDMKKMPPDLFKKIRAAEVQKIAILDIMSLNMDRHSGNLMVDDSDPNNPKLVPIDHGGSMPSRDDFPTAKTRMAGLDNDGESRAMEPLNAVLQVPAAFEKFDPETIARLELLDPDAIEADMKATRATIGKVHAGLQADTVVSDESLHMSKRAMMFLKKAAKDLSPAEIQIALGTQGEALFDAPDSQFDTEAARIIAETAAKKAGYQEICGLSKQQLYDVDDKLQKNGWPRDIIMSDPERAMALYKADTKCTRTTPFKLPPSGTGAVTDAMCQEVSAVFPEWAIETADDGTKKDTYAYFKQIEALNGIATINAAVDFTKGKAPTSAIEAVQLAQAWSVFHTNDYADERAAFKPNPRKGARAILMELMERKANQIQKREALADAPQAAAATDPAAGALAFARTLLTVAEQQIAAFPAVNGAAAMGANITALRTRIDQGPAQNETALDFARAVEAQARTLGDTVFDACVLHARGEAETLQRDLSALNLPDAMQTQQTDNIQIIGRLLEDLSGRGNLFRIDVRLANLRRTVDTLTRSAVAPTTTAPTQPAAQQPNPGETTTFGIDRGTVGMAPLVTFDWTETSASAAKKMAVKSGLFKDQDTGFTKALKAIKTVRETVAKMKSSLAADKKVATLEKAMAGYSSFRIFVGGKFSALSRDPLWEDYCHSISDIIGTELTTLTTRIAAIKNGSGT